MEKTFSQWKKQCLQKVDLSKKGSVDRDIEPVVSLLNSCEDFFTTSSCSGRIIVFDGAAGEIQKQKCTWLFVSHHRCSSDDLMSSLSRSTGDAVLKFEPAVLHVQCRRLEDAQLVHSVAVNSGFRNSGLTVGRTGKIISAVRSTHGLEVPLTHNATLLVDPQYIQFLSQIANQKMEENLRRIHRFYQNIQSALSAERRHIPECPASQDAGHPQQTQEDKGGEEEEENKSNVYTRRRRRQKHDGYNEDRDSSPTQLDDCLHLFT